MELKPTFTIEPMNAGKFDVKCERGWTAKLINLYLHNLNILWELQKWFKSLLKDI